MAEKRPEAFLFKVPVIGEGIGYQFAPHRLHGMQSVRL